MALARSETLTAATASIALLVGAQSATAPSARLVVTLTRDVDTRAMRDTVNSAGVVSMLANRANVAAPTAVASVLMDQLIALATLSDGWDGDGAPAPSTASMQLARLLLDAMTANGLTPDSVDADAVGGVAVWLYDADASGVIARRCAIELRNSGRVVISAETADGARTVRAEPVVEAILSGLAAVR